MPGCACKDKQQRIASLHHLYDHQIFQLEMRLLSKNKTNGSEFTFTRLEVGYHLVKIWNKKQGQILTSSYIPLISLEFDPQY